MRFLRGLAPVALVATGACFATQSDVRQLQANLIAARQESARSDSITQARLRDVIAQMGTVNDSLSQLASRLTRFTGDVRGDLYQMGQQLLAVQELTGQSQRRLQELRTDLEQRGQQIAAEQAQTTGDTTAAAAATTPGPNQLLEVGLEQLRHGSPSAARAAFQQLLQQYPKADVAADAQFYTAEAYAAEGDTAHADSVYAAVVTTYPSSPRAPTALYKQALSLQQAGNVPAARAALNKLVEQYPRSDEAALARERLRTMR
ncbi:MAG TPA: tol-pal system protein YbgF [Gemmatimonadaceae bacterium]|nr:tol-pal system protein YbgF [Gemmatimonadaceae bacterium]